MKRSRRQKRRQPSFLLSLFKGLLGALILFLFFFLIYITQKPNSPFPHISPAEKPPSRLEAPRRSTSPPAAKAPAEELPIAKAPTEEAPAAKVAPPQLPSYLPHPKAKSRGKVAIVIDDVGYDLSLLRQFLQLDASLTFSILPNLPYSTASAELVEREGETFILHMPMQPEGDFPMDASFITVDLSPSQVAARIEKALRSVPGARGMSNHMGSLATQNEAIMTAVMSSLAKHNLFFLDSLTSPRSLGEKCALKAGVPVLKRDVFLDNEEDPQYVLGQIEKLALLALKKGEAIGIGHLRKTTLEGLKLALPYLAGKAIEVVPLNELLR